MFFAGYNNALDSIVQTVVVPQWAETGTLYFAERMTSDDSTIYQYDLFDVQLWDTYGGEFELVIHISSWNTAPRGEWFESHVFLGDISSLQGHPLNLVFVACTDGSLPTRWWIDNVRLVFACGSVTP